MTEFIMGNNKEKIQKTHIKVQENGPISQSEFFQ